MKSISLYSCLTVLLLVSSIGCQPMFQTIDTSLPGSSLIPGPTAVSGGTTPAIGALSTDLGIVKKDSPSCMSDPNFNACLFWKNPVAQNNGLLPVPYSQDADLSSLQVFGVVVRGYDNSGLLKNASIEIVPGGLGASDSGVYVQVPMLAPVSTVSGNFKFRDDGDPDLKLVQVAAFYWLQTQIDFMEARVGKWFGKNKGTRVTAISPDYSNGIFTTTGTIILGNKGNKSFAHYADFVSHEHGHGNVHFATAGRIWQSQGTPGADGQCLPGRNIGSVTCCASRNGCVKALNEGLADYHTAMMFATRPQFGETYGDRPEGVATPAGNAVRNPTQSRNLTVDQAYNVQATINGVVENINGEARSMAVLYTSIWWEMRQTAETAKAGGGREIDQIFSEHLAMLTGADTILSARDKIIAVDSALFGGRYGALIRQEFTRRGY